MRYLPPHVEFNSSSSLLMVFGNVTRLILYVTMEGEPVTSSYVNLPSPGSVSHHLNNVMVIFPHRLRLRLSNQKLLRRQSHQQGLVPRSNNGQEGRKSIPTTPQNSEPPVVDLLYDLQSPEENNHATHPITLPLPLSDSYDLQVGLMGHKVSTGEPQEDEAGEDLMLSADGLLRIPSWACRCASFSHHLPLSILPS